MRDRSTGERGQKIRGVMRNEFGEPKLLLYATEHTYSKQVKGKAAIRMRRTAKKMRRRLRRRYSRVIIDEQLYEMSYHAMLIQLEATYEPYRMY